MDTEVLSFLNKCKLVAKTEDSLEGMLIPRDILLDNSVYESVKEDIVILKKKFSSSSLTSLQKSAELEKKWPLLNLVRQVLKSCHYAMKPVRQSAGYDKEGKKKYRRLFRIVKMKSVKDKESISTAN